MALDIRSPDRQMHPFCAKQIGTALHIGHRCVHWGYTTLSDLLSCSRTRSSFFGLLTTIIAAPPYSFIHSLYHSLSVNLNNSSSCIIVTVNNVHCYVPDMKDIQDSTKWWAVFVCPSVDRSSACRVPGLNSRTESLGSPKLAGRKSITRVTREPI